MVLAAGGFEADPERRRRISAAWDIAIVRGTPTTPARCSTWRSTAGRRADGDWSGAHSVAWDAGAPAQGASCLTNQLTRQSYPLGIVVNSAGERFLDEGADFRNYTYAKYGARDPRPARRRRLPALRRHDAADAATEEYDHAGHHEATRDTIDGPGRAVGIDADGWTETVDEFNASIVDGTFDPA